MTALGDASVEGLTDRGSTPRTSTNSGDDLRVVPTLVVAWVRVWNGSLCRCRIGAVLGSVKALTPRERAISALQVHGLGGKEKLC